MSKGWMMTGLLVIPVLLMSWGSLRYTLTPLGYWLTWGLWAAATAVYVWPERNWRSKDQLSFLVVGAFGVLILGMALASEANHDAGTLYQAVKILVIGVLCQVMWRLVAKA